MISFLTETVVIFRNKNSKRPKIRTLGFLGFLKPKNPRMARSPEKLKNFPCRNTVVIHLCISLQILGKLSTLKFTCSLDD